MRYPPAETAEKHERILAEAARMLRTHGIAGVTVGDLMKAADLTHGSFYNHFASKTALVSDCIDYVNGRAIKRIESYKPTEAGKKAFVAMYLGVESRDDPGHACILSTLAPEISREPEVRPSLARYAQDYIATLAKHFPWRTKAAARREAIRMLSSMVGAMVLARAVEDDAVSREILRTVSAQISTSSAQPAE